MVDPGEIREAIVTTLRTLPELIDEFFEGDEATDKIIEYRDALPTENNLRQFVHDMPAPGILVAHNESGTPSGLQRNPALQARHSFLLFMRVGNVESGDPQSYTRMLSSIIDGVPDGETAPFQHLQLHPHSDLDEWTFESEADAEGVDYRTLELIFSDRWR